jgi:hypothetical protein
MERTIILRKLEIMKINNSIHPTFFNKIFSIAKNSVTFPKIFQKNFSAGKFKKIPVPIHTPINIIPKRPKNPPQSGPAPAPDVPKFQNKAQTEPRLGSANPLSDRKLLEELHEVGVRKSVPDRGSRKCTFFADEKCTLRREGEP